MLIILTASSLCLLTSATRSEVPMCRELPAANEVTLAYLWSVYSYFNFFLLYISRSPGFTRKVPPLSVLAIRGHATKQVEIAQFLNFY
jgi:hypothetical protein